MCIKVYTVKKLFSKVPNKESIELNGVLVATSIERTRSEMKTQRLINALSVIAIGTTLGAIDGFSSARDAFAYYAAPAVINGVMVLRSEVINRRHINDLEEIGPTIQIERSLLINTLTEAGIPIPEILQLGDMQKNID